jgi:hypothetical protein
MKRTSLASKFVKIAARSPERVIIGADVDLKPTPNSLDIIFESVVLPKPGGPYNKTWSNTSFLWLADWMNTFRFWQTLSCPINSSNREGRKFVIIGEFCSSIESFFALNILSLFSVIKSPIG